MRALTQDVGQAEESLDIPYDGEEFEIGFNPQYLIEGIEAVDESDVTLKFTNPLRPGLDLRRGRRLRLPHHADPPERLRRVLLGELSAGAPRRRHPL